MSNAESIMRKAGIPDKEHKGVIMVAQMMNEDPDGLYSMFKDFGWNMEFKDVEKLIEEVN